MKESYLPVNETVTDAVRSYVDAIIEKTTEIDSTTEIECDYSEGNNAAETEKAISCSLVSKYGVVLVWPNFKTQSASACIYNRGLVQFMQLEGFADDEINNSAILGKLLDYTEDHVGALAMYLTKDLGLQAQKDFNCNP